jgi:hypothetical protein
MTIFRLVGGTDVKPTGAIASRAAPKTAPRLIGLASNTTSTAENGRLREQRKNAWWKAEAATRYWRVRLTFHDAVEQAQRMGIPEGRHHPDVDSDDRMPMVQQWRAALARQVLTPAPDANSVKWKQWALDSGDLTYTGVKAERVERAIAEDLAFLAAHPVRQSKRRSAKPSDDGGAA